MSSPGSSPRQLTPFFFALRLDRAISDLLHESMSDSPLTPVEYAVVSAILDGGDDDVTLTRLAETLGAPLTTAATWVERLVQDAVLAKEPHPRDGRGHRLIVTADGRERSDLARAAFGRGYEAFLRHSSRSVTELNAMLQEMAAAAMAATAELRADRAVP